MKMCSAFCLDIHTAHGFMKAKKFPFKVVNTGSWRDFRSVFKERIPNFILNTFVTISEKSMQEHVKVNLYKLSEKIGSLEV